MTDSEYRKYIREIMRGVDMLRRYGNWAVSPWLIKKYGIDRVEEDLQARAGKQYYIREVTYKTIGIATKTKNTYYILEEYDGRQKKRSSTITSGEE